MITCLAINLFPHNVFEHLGQQGEISITVHQSTSIDITEGIPRTSFQIRTGTNAYIALITDEASYFLGENTVFNYAKGVHRLDAGILIIRSEGKAAHEFQFSVDKRYTYTIRGRSFILVKGTKSHLVTLRNGVYVSKKGDLPLDYILETYQRSSMSDGLTIPESIDARTHTVLSAMEIILEQKRADYLSRNIRRYTYTIFKGTQYETPVYRVVHRTPGTNVFVMAPHADERAASIVAADIGNIVIRSGSITTIPSPVAPAAKIGERYVIEDLNRKFYDRKIRMLENEIDKIAIKYQDMLNEYQIHLVLNLHEGFGWHIADKDKEKYGQTIVYDFERFTPTVARVLEHINRRIEVSDLQFSPLLKPMPNTLTYYAAQKNIDAYGIELHRDITLEKKIIMMRAIVEEFLEVYGLY
ncbi:MAG: hypothetical protein AABZ39_09920 [Spirochaetota bacterium]